MKSKKFISLATIFTLASTLLVGCGTSKPSNEVLNIYNVGDYLDESLITKFEEETGIKVVYETYDTPYFNKNSNVKLIHGIFSKKVIIANNIKIRYR